MRWSSGQPTRILAVRDELTSREFDEPGRWWPELPDVVGGRDRVAGGTWCANRVSTGVSALVLNRPDKRLAEPGAASRGVLPLLAVTHEQGWVSHVDRGGMASFALVLATPQRLTTWVFDGQDLVSTDHGAGTHIVTSGGSEDARADRYLALFEDRGYPDGWREVVERATPQDDPAALVVRREIDGLVYATVFVELIEARPGWLRVEHSREPWTSGRWEPFAVG